MLGPAIRLALVGAALAIASAAPLEAENTEIAVGDRLELVAQNGTSASKSAEIYMPVGWATVFARSVPKLSRRLGIYGDDIEGDQCGSDVQSQFNCTEHACEDLVPGETCTSYDGFSWKLRRVN